MSRFIVFAAIASVAAACSAKEACVPPSIEPVNELTTQQVGQLAAHQAQSSGQYGAVLWSFDDEDHPQRGTEIAIAFLLVSTGDIGSKPVGALIWANKAVGAVLKAGALNEFVVEFASPDERCAGTRAAIRLQPDGTVMADKRRLGQVK
jgi:hypothetical protein